MLFSSSLLSSYCSYLNLSRKSLGQHDCNFILIERVLIFLKNEQDVLVLVTRRTKQFFHHERAFPPICSRPPMWSVTCVHARYTTSKAFLASLCSSSTAKCDYSLTDEWWKCTKTCRELQENCVFKDKMNNLCIPHASSQVVRLGLYVYFGLVVSVSVSFVDTLLQSLFARAKQTSLIGMIKKKSP